jgi:hypothetical protein
MEQLAQEFEIHKLRELGKKHGTALKNLVQLEDTKKILKATIMLEYQIGANGKPNSVSAQETFAYADERYKKHIDAIAEATGLEMQLRWEKRIIEIKLELIKVESFNENAEKKAYSI